jgi:hypothetical protein
MNKEKYFRLRKLEENKNLTDEEFYNKYIEDFNSNFLYKQNNSIKDSNFIDNMVDIKNSIEKKVIMYEKNKR